MRLREEGLIIFIVANFGVLTYLQNEVDAISPLFPRQVVIDRTNDWASSNFLDAPTSSLNASQCKEVDSFFSSMPDIEEINYLSDGKTLNATIWLSSSFKEPSEQYDFSLNRTTQHSNSSNDKNLVAVEIKVLDNKNYTLNEYTNQRIISLRTLPSFDLVESSTTTISDIIAHKISYTYKKLNDEIEATKVWTVANNKVYTITYLADKDRYSYYLPSVQSMLQSFNIDLKNSANQTEGINGYQTYADNVLGIKLQYPSDWKSEISKNNSNLVLFHPPLRESMYKRGTTIVMAMDVNSGYDFRGEDYRVTLDWDPNIRNWTRLVQESRSSMGEDRSLASGEYIILQQQNNYGDFFNEEKNYVKIVMDLSAINFPDQYSLVFFITESYTNWNSTCNIDLFDMSDEVHVPPPDFTFIVSPSSISLRPGEEAKMELQIKNTNAKLNSYVVLSTNTTKGIDATFIPNSTSVPPSGLSTSLINIRAADNASNHPHTFPIIANITFPSQLTNYLTNEKYNSTGGARIVEYSDVTVTVLPSVSFQEQFQNVITDWFNPLTSTYTTIVTIVTGILGWRIWKKRQKAKK
jgi:hypothetical protein